MAKVWVIPDGGDARGAQDGDYVIKSRDGGVLIGRRRGGSTEWLGDADARILPQSVRNLLTDTGAPTALDDPDAVRAVQGIASAEQQRGG